MIKKLQYRNSEKWTQLLNIVPIMRNKVATVIYTIPIMRNKVAIAINKAPIMRNSHNCEI